MRSRSEEAARTPRAKRDGATSAAAMLFEVSSTIARSIPLRVIVSVPWPHSGRAAATIAAVTATSTAIAFAARRLALTSPWNRVRCASPPANAASARRRRIPE
jgi:hypothetical protein